MFHARLTVLQSATGACSGYWLPLGLSAPETGYTLDLGMDTPSCSQQMNLGIPMQHLLGILQIKPHKNHQVIILPAAL